MDDRYTCLNFVYHCSLHDTNKKLKSELYEKYNIKNKLIHLHSLKDDGYIYIEFKPKVGDDKSFYTSPFLDNTPRLTSRGIQLKEDYERKNINKLIFLIMVISNILLVICTIIQTINLFI